MVSRAAIFRSSIVPPRGAGHNAPSGYRDTAMNGQCNLKRNAFKTAFAAIHHFWEASSSNVPSGKATLRSQKLLVAAAAGGIYIYDQQPISLLEVVRSYNLLAGMRRSAWHSP
jgi:hypothetical protein